MGRQLRIEYKNAMYHIIARGNGFQWLYKSAKQVDLFKNLIKEIVIKYKVRVHAVVLMLTHYHMLIETPLANLTKVMRKFNRDFALLFNLQSGRKGAVFKDRYKSILIDKENYYFNVLRYICQNPLRVNIVDRCENYEGSYLNWMKDPDFMNYIYLDKIKGQFSHDNKEWYNAFLNWVNDTVEPDPMQDSKYKYLLGDENWLGEIFQKIEKKKIQGHKEAKKYNICLDGKKLEEVLRIYSEKEAEKIRMYLYSKYSGMTSKEICEFLNIKSKFAFSQCLWRFKKKINRNQQLAKKLNEIEEKAVREDVKSVKC